MRHIPVAAIILTLLACLAGCGQEAQTTAVVVANSAATTATAVAQAANATTTAAFGAIPSVGLPSSLPSPPGGPPGGSAAPILPTARPPGASVPPVVATVFPSGVPTPGGSRPPIGPPSAQPSGSGPGGTALPAGFPMPTQYQVVSSAESGGQIIVVLGVSSAQDAYNFYKGALPGAGYQVTDPGGVSVPGAGFVANLSVTSGAYDGNLSFTPGGPNGQAVTIQLRKK